MSTLELENIKHPDNSGNNIALNSNGSMVVDRQSTDGTIIDFRKSGTNIGTIGVDNGDNLTISGNSHAGLNFSDNDINPYKNGAYVDGIIDLGYTTSRFKDLHLSGGIYVGGQGSANYLDDYEEGTFTPNLQNVSLSYSAQQGTYTKIGNVVTVRFEVGVTGLDTSDGSAFQIGGFPFTVSASGCLFTMDTENSTVLTNKPLIIGARPNVNHTSLRLLKNNTEYSYNSGTNSSGFFIGMIKYFTN